MSARQPRHHVVRIAVWDLVSGNHQGQQPRALRKQAGHTTASDRRSYQLKKCLAMQEPSTHDIQFHPYVSCQVAQTSHWCIAQHFSVAQSTMRTTPHQIVTLRRARYASNLMWNLTISP